MYELVQAGGRSYYFDCPAKIGLIRLDGEDVCLIDSGGDKDAGRKVRQTLEKNGWRLRAVYLTHSHADHIGGCRYLQSQTGCRIYAPGIEWAFTRHPILEPALLYGGYPPKALRHKFLLAQESDASCLAPEDLPEGLSLIDLPGHSLQMVGYRTSDDVVYLGDCLASRETLEKYRISYLYDVAAYLDTLERVKAMTARMFVPAHAPAAPDVSGLAQYNIDCVQETAGRILELCAHPTAFEEILRQLFAGYGLTMDFQQYALVGSTVRSYLSWLLDRALLDVGFESGRLLWHRT